MKNKFLIILVTIISFKIIATFMLIPLHEELKKYEEKAANLNFDTAQLIELSQNDKNSLKNQAKTLLPGTKIENNSEFITGKYIFNNVIFDNAILYVNDKEYIISPETELKLDLKNTDQVFLKEGYLIYYLENK